MVEHLEASLMEQETWTLPSEMGKVKKRRGGLRSLLASAIREDMSDGIIEVDLFSRDVDSADHPQARRFKKLLEDVAKQYRCKLMSFEVEHGTVSFSFDSDVLVAEILKVLKTEHEDD
jgi:hypothetical protein